MFISQVRVKVRVTVRIDVMYEFEVAVRVA